jgi:hypothetical protein
MLAGEPMTDLFETLHAGRCEDIETALEDAPEAIVVDWQEEETDLVSYVADQLPNHNLTVTLGDDESTLLVTFDDQVTPVRLSLSRRDRYVTVRALNDIFANQLEMRLSTPRFYSDTHVFLCLERTRWAELEAVNPVIANLFVKPDETTDSP